MQIIWTKFAREDLKAVHAYIARDSVYYANQIVQKITKAVAALQDFPELGQVVTGFVRYAIRERIVQNYRVFYTIERSRIVVLAVVHAARDIHSIVMPERN
jgi:toxin ParE1/3/4